MVLVGLSDEDALELWHAFVGERARASVAHLLRLFSSFGNYPLLIRALAGEVAQFRPAPGNFAAWSLAHPTFDPYELPLENAKAHVLSFALQGL